MAGRRISITACDCWRMANWSKHSSFAASTWATRAGARSGKRLGYSQVVNPVYLTRKGTMKSGMAADLIVRNVVSNLLRSLKPEPWIDRRGRPARQCAGVRRSAARPGRSAPHPGISLARHGRRYAPHACQHIDRVCGDGLARVGADRRRVRNARRHPLPDADHVRHVLAGGDRHHADPRQSCGTARSNICSRHAIPPKPRPSAC